MAKAKTKAGGGVIVTGNEEVDKALAEMPARVQKSVFRKAIRPAAKTIVLPAAQANAPFATGDLEASLQVKAIQRDVVMRQQTKGKYAGKMGAVNLNANKIGAQVQTKEGFYQGEQFYGAFTEFGTKVRTRKGSGATTGAVVEMAWMRRALYDNEEKVHRMVQAAVKAAINETRSFWQRDIT